MTALFFAALPAALLGCGGPRCVDVNTACTPLFTPSYDEIYQRTLRPTCAQPGPGCHASEGGQGGLRFDDPDFAYTLLTEAPDGLVPRVIAGDASCSLLVRRLASPSPGFQMPPGAPLPAAEQCAIVQWVEAGAPR